MCQKTAPILTQGNRPEVRLAIILIKRLFFRAGEKLDHRHFRLLEPHPSSNFFIDVSRAFISYEARRQKNHTE